MPAESGAIMARRWKSAAEPVWISIAVAHIRVKENP
jgi:hypothetical protein